MDEFETIEEDELSSSLFDGLINGTQDMCIDTSSGFDQAPLEIYPFDLSPQPASIPPHTITTTTVATPSYFNTLPQPLPQPAFNTPPNPFAALSQQQQQMSRSSFAPNFYPPPAMSNPMGMAIKPDPTTIDDDKLELTREPIFHKDAGFILLTSGDTAAFAFRLPASLRGREVSIDIRTEILSERGQKGGGGGSTKKNSEAKGGGAIFLHTGATPSSSSESKSRGKKRSKQSCEQSIRSDGTLELSFGTKNSGMNIICYQFWVYDGLNGNGQRYLAQSCPAIICSHKNQQEKALTALLCYVYRNRTQVDGDEVRNLFRLFGRYAHFVDDAFAAHPWCKEYLAGSQLEDALEWFFKACTSLENAPTLWARSLMFGYMDRDTAEALIGQFADGCFLIRISSKGSIVFTAKLPVGVRSVDFDQSTEEGVLLQMGRAQLQHLLYVVKGEQGPTFGLLPERSLVEILQQKDKSTAGPTSVTKSYIKASQIASLCEQVPSDNGHHNGT